MFMGKMFHGSQQEITKTDTAEVYQMRSEKIKGEK